MPRTLYIIDGHAQIYRAYYAPFRDLTAPSGEPTRATHVFCQMLLNLIRDRRPDYLVMTLDMDERQLLRKQLYPDYKAHRDPAPEDLHVQERRIISILETARVPLLCQLGHEADDITATLARRLAGPDLHVYVVSRDKDLEQLLTEHVSLYDPMKDEVITPERLRETKGWGPERAIEAQILTGDDVDNVPGVMGIGPKTAAKLLDKYGSARGVVEHADELTPKQRENVLAFAPQIEMVRQLVTLNDQVPIELDLAAAEPARFAWAAVRPVFLELGMRRLSEQLPAGAEAPQPTEAQAATVPTPGATSETHDSPPSQGGVGGGAGIRGEAASLPTSPQAGERLSSSLADPALCEPDGGQYILVNTPEALERLAQELAAQPEFALDTETTGLHPLDCDLVGLCLAWRKGIGYYIPVRSVYGTVLPLEQVRQRLGPLFADPQTLKIGQNLKYDLNVLHQAGLPVAGPLFDTMIAAFVVDPARGQYGIDHLAPQYFGHTMIPITDLIGTSRPQLTMDQVPLEHITEYAAEDADYTWRLKQHLAQHLGPTGVEQLFYGVEMPLVSVLTEMERNGISIDAEYLRQMSSDLSRRVDQLADEVHKLAGRMFNLDSPKQLAEVLFDELKFRVVKRTKTARSTDADVLDALAAETQHPIFALLLEHREIQKLRGTYVDALPLQRSKRTGRIHTSYHQTGAITGRLSSSEPNLQNIPVRTELGRQIRRAFVPRSPDEVLIVADYSQVELRILAHYSEDEALRQAFAEDRDIHAFVAAQVHNVPLDAVTKEMRSQAKAVNFGIVYGQTAFGLAQSTGMSRSAAQAFIDGYFRRYPRIRGFIEQCVSDAKRDGHVRTILGRRRPIEFIDSRNAARRAQAERLAVNTVIQGSAADLIKVAMLRLHARIAREKLLLRMLLQVHDELVCEGPRQEADALGAIVKAEMSGAMEFRVPLKVDVASGENWLEAK